MFDEIRDAASVVLVRDRAGDPKVLVGQRGSRAAFMPNKYVFPGGALDPDDSSMQLLGRPSAVCLDRLQIRSGQIPVDQILLCAVREVWEETGLRLAEYPDSPTTETEFPGIWMEFCRSGLRPSADGLIFFSRAITPPGRTRRFDARFFFGDIDSIPLSGDPDDFSAASDELANLQWIPLEAAGRLNIAFITSLVLAELTRMIQLDGPPDRVPFRYQEDGVGRLDYL